MPEPATSESTLFEKVWQPSRRQGRRPAESPAILYIDLQLLHEVTSPQAFDELKRREPSKYGGPDRCLATIESLRRRLRHPTPMVTHAYVTDRGPRASGPPACELCEQHGIELHSWDSPNRGIVHVMGPEMGATQPGMTIVCGDSHTATHGAVRRAGVRHRHHRGRARAGKPVPPAAQARKTWESGSRVSLNRGVTAKDVILHVIGTIGVHGGTGSVIEYHGLHSPFDGHGEPHDPVQHVHRVRRARRYGGARRHYLRISEMPADGALRSADWDRAAEDWKTLKTDDGREL